MWIHTKFDGLGRDTLSVFNVLHSGLGSLRSPTQFIRVHTCACLLYYMHLDELGVKFDHYFVSLLSQLWMR